MELALTWVSRCCHLFENIYCDICVCVWFVAAAASCRCSPSPRCCGRSNNAMTATVQYRYHGNAINHVGKRFRNGHTFNKFEQLIVVHDQSFYGICLIRAEIFVVLSKILTVWTNAVFWIFATLWKNTYGTWNNSHD